MHCVPGLIATHILLADGLDTCFSLATSYHRVPHADQYHCSMLAQSAYGSLHAHPRQNVTTLIEMGEVDL